MSAVIGEGLKPLTTSQTPSENSQAATEGEGRDHLEAPETLPDAAASNSAAMTAARSRGAPISPTIGMIRGRDRYISEPSSRALMHGMRVCPSSIGPVVNRDVGRAGGDERGRVGLGRSAQVTQGHQREQAEHAGEDHGGFQEASGDKAERDAFVLPLDHRVQRDGGADAGQRDDHLEEGPDEYACVAAGGQDPCRWIFTGP